MPRAGEGGGGGRLGEAHFLSILISVVIYVVVSDLCRERPSCSVLASPETFTQDPCLGRSKYLEVHYKCTPNEFEELTVCEGEEMDIGCHQGNRIAIFAAMFGRKPNGTAKCPPYKQGYIDCQAAGTISEVRNQCHSRKKCSLLANASEFGDPCAAGIHKYLTVSYACVPKKYLKQLHRKSGRRRKKKKRKNRKRKKNKKRKGLDKLLPQVISATTTSRPPLPESPFDKFYETFEKEDITPGDLGTSEETSTSDIEEKKKFLDSTADSSNEETPPFMPTPTLTPESTSNAQPRFPSSELPTDPDTSSSREIRPPPDTGYVTDISSEEPSTEETSPYFRMTTAMEEEGEEEDVPESETQEIIPSDKIVTTVNPKFVTRARQDSTDGLTTSKHKLDVVTDNRGEEKATSGLTTPESALDESTGVEVDSRNSYGNQDLTSVNLKSDKNDDRENEKGKENSYGISNENDKDKKYNRVREESSPERTSVTSNPTTLDQSPKNKDDIKSNVHKQGHGPSDTKRRKTNKQKPVLVVERNLTVLCPNNSQIPTDIRWGGRQRPRDIHSIGFLEDWINTWYFLTKHEEKAWLYFTLGICFGIIVLLIIILIKVCISFKRNIRARLDVSEPTHRSAHINNHSSLDAPMLEHSDSIDRIEFVQFHPRGTLRSMRSSNSHNRDLVNYYG